MIHCVSGCIYYIYIYIYICVCCSVRNDILTHNCNIYLVFGTIVVLDLCWLLELMLCVEYLGLKSMVDTTRCDMSWICNSVVLFCIASCGPL